MNAGRMEVGWKLPLVHQITRWILRLLPYAVGLEAFRVRSLMAYGGCRLDMRPLRSGRILGSVCDVRRLFEFSFLLPLVTAKCVDVARLSFVGSCCVSCTRMDHLSRAKERSVSVVT